MTFRDLVLETKKAFHFNTDFYAETVSYTPHGGSARSINVHIVEQDDLDIENVDTETDTKQITVKCLKDGTLGIDKPNLGDTIVRLSSSDLDSSAYYFSGEIDAESIDSWRLTFKRIRRDAQGFHG